MGLMPLERPSWSTRVLHNLCVSLVEKLSGVAVRENEAAACEGV